MATGNKASKSKKKVKKAPAKKKVPAKAKKKAPARKKASADKKAPAKKKSSGTTSTSRASRSGKTNATSKRAKAKVVKTAVRRSASRKNETKRKGPRTAAKNSSGGQVLAAAVLRPGEGVEKKAKSRKTPVTVRSGLRKIKRALLEKRHLLFEQLQAELKEMERPEKRHRADLEEIASDTHDSDSLCQIMDINASQLDQIDAALKKIDEGTYGICEDCDEEISLPRLEALPFATQCIECKRRAELSQVRPAEYYSAGFE